MLRGYLSYVVVFFLLFVLPGCAGKRVRTEYEVSQAQSVNVFRLVEAPVQTDGPPYHVAFRVNPGVLDQVLAVSLSDDLIDDEKLDVIRQEADVQLDRFRQRGPLARRIADRVSTARDDRFGEFTPTLRVQSVKTRVDGSCEGCLRLDLDLQGGLKSKGVRPLTMGGTVALISQVSSETSDDGPAIQVRLKEVRDLDLQFPSHFPGPFSQVETRLEEQLQEQLTLRVRERGDRSAMTLPLGDHTDLGHGVKLEKLGVHTIIGEKGELLVGLNTNLSASPNVSIEARAHPLDEWDWALEVEDQVIEQMVRLGIQAGEIPTRFTRKGKPDPEGPLAFDLQRVRMTREGFEIGVRFWYFKFPAWWRDYTLRGTLEMVEGRLVPRIDEMIPGEGDGAAWVSSLAARRVSSDRAVGRMGGAFPSAFPLKMAEGYEVRLAPLMAVAQDGRLVVYGRMEVAPMVSEEGEPR